MHEHARAHAAGLTHARLETDPGTRAEGFYRRRGWVPLGLNAKGEVVMESPLAPSPAA
jgi:hypothetical protein